MQYQPTIEPYKLSDIHGTTVDDCPNYNFSGVYLNCTNFSTKLQKLNTDHPGL